MKALIFVLCLMTQLAWATAGRIDLVEGDVRLFNAARQERPARLGGEVNEGDALQTGANGEVHLAMADGGQLAIRPNTRLAIASYRADGGSDDKSVFSLLEGAMRSITGWIGRYNQQNYQIRTPTATIGVRGTDHETWVIPAGSPAGEAGTYDKVNIGATRMTTPYGAADVRPNQAGFIPAKGRGRPVLLLRVPEFFRPTRNEHRLEGLHDRIHSRLDHLRQERSRQLKTPGQQRENRRELRHRERDVAMSRRDERHPAAQHGWEGEGREHVPREHAPHGGRRWQH